MEIRPAKLSDIPFILGELKKFDRQGGVRSIYPGDDYAAGAAENLIRKHRFQIADDGKRQLGFLAAMVMPHWMNPAVRTAAELFWWVGEEYRGSSAGIRLLKDYSQWAKSNVDWATACLQHNSPVRDETMERNGFKKYETTFLMDTEVA